MMGSRAHVDPSVAAFADFADLINTFRDAGVDAVLAKLEAAVQGAQDALDAQNKALDDRKGELDRREYSLDRLDTSLTGRRETIDADTLALAERETRNKELTEQLAGESRDLEEQRTTQAAEHAARSQALDAEHQKRVSDFQAEVARTTADLERQRGEAEAKTAELRHREEELAGTARDQTAHGALLDARDRQTKEDSQKAAAARAELERRVAAVRAAAGA